MAHIEVQVMISLGSLVPVYLQRYLPPGAADITVSKDYEKGDIRLRPGPIITIFTRDESSELIIGDLIPDRQGIVQEIVYFSDDDYLAAKDIADKGEFYVYAAGNRIVFQGFITMNQGEPELIATLSV